jgi:hypothetical protein
MPLPLSVDQISPASPALGPARVKKILCGSSAKMPDNEATRSAPREPLGEEGAVNDLGGCTIWRFLRPEWAWLRHGIILRNW